jgi:hypothetical protein
MHADTAAQALAHLIAASGLTPREVSRRAGLTRPSLVTMMVQGLIKVPVPKAPALARACGADPLPLLRLAMLEDMPEVWAAIEERLPPPGAPEEASR